MGFGSTVPRVRHADRRMDKIQPCACVSVLLNTQTWRPGFEMVGYNPLVNLPARIHDIEQLDELLSRPSDALARALERAPGDIIVLGVGGKMGPTLARMAKRAAPDLRVIGVARFS